MNDRSPSVAGWLIRKMAPFLICGVVAGVTIGFLKALHPDALRGVQIAGSVCFGCAFLLFSWWAINRPATGYKWSLPERLGIFISAMAALLVCIRLALPTLPGPMWAYFVGAFMLAFVVRPIMDNYGWRKYHGEQSRGTLPRVRGGHSEVHD